MAVMQRGLKYIQCIPRNQCKRFLWRDASSMFQRQRSLCCAIMASPRITLKGTDFRHHKRDNSSFAGAPSSPIISTLSELEYEQVSNDTLEELAARFDELGEQEITGEDYDAQYSSGVLTVRLGGGKGTYVINKQTPNRQIWLSSPTSGPKRYDFLDGVWIYKRDGCTLHCRLSEEISSVLGMEVDFKSCKYGS